MKFMDSWQREEEEIAAHTRKGNDDDDKPTSEGFVSFYDYYKNQI
jgi:hypothetical protein